MTTRREAIAPALVLFAILVAHTLLETARDALFLARLGPDRLALVYLAMAAFALAVFAALRRWAGLREPRALLIAFLGTAAAGTALFAIAIAGSRTVVFAFYVWTGLVATLVVPTFWTLIDRSLRVGEAKGVFALIGAGGVLGAMVGSALAGLLGRVVPAEALVAIGAIAYAVALVAAIALAPRRTVNEPRKLARRAESLSREARRYVVLLVLVGLLSTVAITLGDLLFKRAIARHFAPEELATVFGAIYAGLNTLGLAIQLFVTQRLLERWGVGAALSILPAILALTGLGYAATGAAAAVVALKLGDGGLRHSMHRVSSELLYLPVPAAMRDRWKPVADALVLRGGEALAALVAFAIALAGVDLRVLAAIAGAAAAAWWLVVPIIHRAYLGQFRDTLRAGEIEREARVPRLDGDTVELLVEALASPDEVEASAALDLLAGRARVPALVLYHPRAVVVHRALSLLERDARHDVDRALGHLLDHPDAGIRAAALAAASGSQSYRARQIAALVDADPRVRAAALVGLAGDPTHGPAAVGGIAALFAGSTEERVALAQAIGHAPDLRMRDLLYALLGTHEPPVVREVVRVLARDPEHADLDRLLELLAVPHARRDIRRVFLAAGRRGLTRLLAALGDPQTPLVVRQHLPRTIGRFGNRRAAAALIARLPQEPDGTTAHKILRALGRMRAAEPGLRIHEATIRAYAARAVAEAARYATLADALATQPHVETTASLLIGELLRDEYHAWMEHAFRALGILRPRAGLRSVHDALDDDDDARRSAACEILEARAPGALRAPLLALVEGHSADERRTRLGVLAAGPFASYAALIETLIADPSESVRCIAAYHVAEAHLVAVRPELVRLRAESSPAFVHDAFDQAIARLDAGG